MMPKWHILFGFLFSYVLVYFFNFTIFAGLIVFSASIFIDLDHAWLYFLDTKDINPSKFWEYSCRKRAYWRSLSKEDRNSYKKPHFIFHGIEFIIILILLSFLFSIFLWILIGFLFHLFLDYIVLIYEKEHLSIKTSQLWLWQRNKNKKKFAVI